MNNRGPDIDLIGRLAERIDLNAAASAPPLERAPAPVPAPETTTASREAPPPARTAPLVELDMARLGKAGFITSTQGQTLTLEQYRIIKRPLLRAAFRDGQGAAKLSNVLMITSPRPNDGKTFTALNLALSIASEPDVRPLVVDCDVRHKGLSQVLGMGERLGLMDALRDRSLSLADIIVRTNVPGLSVIPAGQFVEHPAEALGSQRMAGFIHELSTRYPDRLVLLDTPPVLVASEPVVLAGHVGQAVVVVLANETSKQAVVESLSLIDACPSISFILNKITPYAASGKFGHYGSYSYS